MHVQYIQHVYAFLYSTARAYALIKYVILDCLNKKKINNIQNRI
jgi:hypothetical protein